MLPVIGVTMGDAAGVGAEVAVKAFAHEEIYRQCVPVLIGDVSAVQDAIEFTGLPLTVHKIEDPAQAKGVYGTIDIMDMQLLPKGSWKYKKVNVNCGEASFRYVEKGIHLAMEEKLHAVVTGPICKEAVNLAGHHYSGHTEIFADLTGAQRDAMMLTSQKLRVIHVSTHVSLREACDRAKKERILEVVRLADEAVKLLGIKQPRIAVAGLNPHCSEGGMFGSEEAEQIVPAVQQAVQEGISAEGPIPPDTVFVKAMGGAYDIVVAMYHDQGHIPLKLSGFQMDPKTGNFTSLSGVNITVGLPIIRTSVDHGTAFDRAGDNTSNEESMIEAMEQAVLMAKNKFSL